MMLDFQAWISHLKTESMSIILHNTDNNEEIIRHPGSYHPLHYSNKHVKSSMHDGSLTTLLHTCHLTDALALQHPPPYPRTYIRGRKDLTTSSYQMIYAPPRHPQASYSTIPSAWVITGLFS